MYYCHSYYYHHYVYHYHLVGGWKLLHGVFGSLVQLAYREGGWRCASGRPRGSSYPWRKSTLISSAFIILYETLWYLIILLKLNQPENYKQFDIQRKRSSYLLFLQRFGFFTFSKVFELDLLKGSEIHLQQWRHNLGTKRILSSDQLEQDSRILTHKAYKDPGIFALRDFRLVITKPRPRKVKEGA